MFLAQYTFFVSRITLQKYTKGFHNSERCSLGKAHKLSERILNFMPAEAICVAKVIKEAK